MGQTTWGGWHAWADCPPNLFISDMNVKFQDWQGNGWITNDDTAANSIKFICRSLEITGKEKEIEAPGGGVLGQWKGYQSKADMFVCGAESRSEKAKGLQDDSAFNGLKLQMCSIQHI